MLVDLKIPLWPRPCGLWLVPFDRPSSSLFFLQASEVAVYLDLHTHLSAFQSSLLCLQHLTDVCAEFISSNSLYILSTLGISMIAAELTGLPFNLPQSWVLFRDYCAAVKLCMHCPSLLLCSLKRICLSFQQYPHKNIYDQSSRMTACKWNVTIKQGDQWIH